MKWMKLEFDNIFSLGKKGFTNVDIILGGVLLNDDAWLQRGEGESGNPGKSDYIISECSLTI